MVEITENNIKVAAKILNNLAENKCTVADAQSILSFVGQTINHRATVPEQDYFADFTSRFLSD